MGGWYEPRGGVEPVRSPCALGVGERLDDIVGDLAVRGVGGALVVEVGDRCDGHNVVARHFVRREVRLQGERVLGQELGAMGEVLSPLGRHGLRDADHEVVFSDLFFFS